MTFCFLVLDVRYVNGTCQSFRKKAKGKNNSIEGIEANAGGVESNNIASVLVLATLRYVCVGNMDLCGCQL
jgi:hypothetical protein